VLMIHALISEVVESREWSPKVEFVYSVVVT